MYAQGMEVLWDRTKARQNVAKHGVRFADAVLVLDDPYAITVADNESAPTEARWVTLGADAQGRVLGGGLHVSRRGHSTHLRAVR